MGLSGAAAPAEAGSNDPVGEDLVEQARDRIHRRMSGREWVVSWLVALLFVVAAGLLATQVASPRDLSPILALALVVSYALASRVRFWIGAGYTVPTQLILVPMLFLLPTPVVPALVALAQVLGDLPELSTGRRHAERALMSIGDSWYAIAPAVVLTAAGADGFDSGLWPVYLAALAAQFGLDLLINVARDWFELGVSPRRVLVDGTWIYAVDALLAPVGLLAAAAASTESWLFALALPIIVLLAVFARERERRLNNALELSQAYRGASTLLADLLQDDDEYTGLHSRDVVSLSVAVAEELELSPHRSRDTEFAALLHDIGKIAVPKDIINKPGPLDDEEWAVMRRHTIEGQEMLDRIGGALGRVGVIVRASHERWDGDGYPDGLAGEAIPMEARIVATCDAYNAMTTTRSYREALPIEMAQAELRACAGTQFDPVVVAALLRAVEAEGEGAAEQAALRLVL